MNNTPDPAESASLPKVLIAPPPNMPTKPSNWNVVINGAWNRAILTPDGIRKRLFKLPDGTPLLVEVAVDQPGRFRVGHEGILVSPSSQQLDISVQTNDLASIQNACQIGRTALEALPETPVAAAGVNLRYSISPVPDSLLDLVKAALDDELSDAGYTIKGSLTQRTIERSPGVVNVELVQKTDGECELLLNFHLASKVPSELQGWLTKSDEFFEQSETLLSAMNVSVDWENQNGQP